MDLRQLYAPPPIIAHIFCERETSKYLVAILFRRKKLQNYLYTLLTGSLVRHGGIMVRIEWKGKYKFGLHCIHTYLSIMAQLRKTEYFITQTPPLPMHCFLIW